MNEEERKWLERALELYGDLRREQRKREVNWR